MSALDTNRPGKPLVSVVIPVYNGANYLAEAIDSALAQTWSNIEVIVVDDGSDDNGATARICAEYGDKIRYYYKVNGGVATAVNFGIQVMRGAYFNWLSHDDVFTPDRVASMLEAHSRITSKAPLSEPIILFSDFDIIDHNGDYVRTVHLSFKGASAGEAVAIHWVPHGCGFFIPRHCFELSGLLHPRLPTTQDADIWLRLRRIARLEHVPAVTVRGRQHAEQGTHAPWHLRETSLYRMSILDQMNANLIRAPGVSRADRYRRMLEKGGLHTKPGVWQNARLRFEREVSDQSITLLSVGNAPQVLRDRVRRLWALGYRVTVVGVKKQDPGGVIEACSNLNTDLVWLWDKPLKAPVKTLSGMIRCMAASPGIAGCVPVSGCQPGASSLGPFEGALLSTRIFKDPLTWSTDKWCAVAHSAVRHGGVRRYQPGAGHDFATQDAFPAAERQDAEEAAVYTRRGSVPGLVKAARAYGWHPLLWGRTLIGEAFARLFSPFLDGRAPWVGGPSVINVVFAKVMRYRVLGNALNRAVWCLSSSPEIACQRLLRLHGLAAHFDPIWYARAYPDVHAAGIDPLMHYLCSGRWSERDPSAGFSTRRYLADHPDVAAGRWHAVQHYELWGRFQSRRVSRSSLAERVDLAQRIDADAVYLVVCPAGRCDGRRFAQSLGAQLRRSVRIVIVHSENEECYRLDDGSTGECLSKAALTTDDVVSRIRGLSVRGILVLASLDGEGDVTWLPETIKLPYDIVHLPGGRGLSLSTAGRERFLREASNHYALTTDVARTLVTFDGTSAACVVPLPDPGRLGFMRPWLRNVLPGECCRVALFGALTREDGLGVVIEALKIVDYYDLPFVFFLYGTVEGLIPKQLQSRFHQLSVNGEEHPLTDAVCRLNPHLAWIPYRHPANAVFPLADAAMSGLAIAASDSIDSRSYLAGRPLTWLLSPTAGARAWLTLLQRIHQTRVRDPWTPRYPLEGFQARDKVLSERILDSLSWCQE